MRRTYWRVMEKTNIGPFNHSGIYETEDGAQKAIEKFPLDQQENMYPQEFIEGQDYGPGWV